MCSEMNTLPMIPQLLMLELSFQPKFLQLESYPFSPANVHCIMYRTKQVLIIVLTIKIPKTY